MSKFLFSTQKENNITRKFYSDSYKLPENKINVQIKKLKLLKKFLKILLFTRFIQYYLRIMINLTKKFIKSFFLLRPRFLSTIFFIPLLYLIGWVLAQPLLLLDFQKENLSLIGTIFTFFLFIFLIPSWFNVRWKIRNTWEILGVNKNNFLQNIFDFSKGILISNVKDNSKAFKSGLREGMIIVRVGQSEVSNLSVISNAIEKAKKQKRNALLMLVNFEGTDRFVAVEIF